MYMHNIKSFVFVAFVVAVCALSVFSQSASTTADVSASKYDAELAKKVGADERGMRRYVIAFLKTGPNDSKVTGDARKAVFQGHFDNMGRLAKEGKLAVAGPFNDPGKIYRGLFILAVDTVEEAKALAETDPTVKAGVLMVEYVPWYGSASLMLSNEFHEKVQKKGF